MDAATLNFLQKRGYESASMLRDRFIGYSENEAQLEVFVHPTKLIFVRFHCIVAVFPLTHLPVAYDR